MPNRSKLVRASYTFGGGDAPHERPPRRQMHDAGEVESRAHGEDSVEWAGERREGVLTPAVTDSLAWASSFSGAAASTAMESGAVKESVPSVLHSCRMSTKNASKTQPLAVFQQSTSTDNNPYLLPRSVLPPHLGYVGCTLSRRQAALLRKRRFCSHAYRVAVWCSRHNFRYISGWLNRPYSSANPLPCIALCSLG